MKRLLMLWPPCRRQQAALDAWCADHSDALTIIASRIAQLGITIPDNTAMRKWAEDE